MLMAVPTYRAAGNAIRGAASVLALLPGVALLTQAVALPPSLATTIQALSLACGVLVVLLVQVGHEKIYSASKSAFILTVLGAAAVGCAMMLYHLNFASDHLLIFGSARDEAMIALPTSPSPRLQEILDDFGGDYAEAVMNPTIGPEAKRLIEEENGVANVIIVTTLLLAQLLLTFSIVATAWRTAKHLEK